MSKKLLFGYFLFAFSLGLSSCTRNPVSGNREFMLFSESRELEIGAEYDLEMIRMFGVYEDPELQSFIESKGMQMGKISHRPHLEYHFRILDSPIINAFAVPGGYIYFTRGLLAHLNSEAELIGVLGHEMGHITARHALARQSKSQITRLLLLGGALVSEEFAQFANLASVGLELVFLQYSRGDEREADRLGVEYSAKIGYDASKFADFFQLLVKMQLENKTAGIPTFLSTHPDPGNRYESVNRQAAEWKQTLGEQSWKVNRNNYLRMIDGMIYGENPLNGYVANEVFYHPGERFFFSLPQNWQQEKNPGQWRFTSPLGQELLLFGEAYGNSLDEAANFQAFQLGLNVIEKENIFINGLPAIRLLSEPAANSYEGSGPLLVRTLMIDFREKYYAFHGVAPQRNFQEADAVFDRTFRSFAPLTDWAKINVRPQRIRIRRIQQTTSMYQALRNLGVAENQIEEFALLNNIPLSDTIEAGSMIKTISR